MMLVSIQAPVMRDRELAWKPAKGFCTKGAIVSSMSIWGKGWRTFGG